MIETGIFNRKKTHSLDYDLPVDPYWCTLIKSYLSSRSIECVDLTGLIDIVSMDPVLTYYVLVWAQEYLEEHDCILDIPQAIGVIGQRDIKKRLSEVISYSEKHPTKSAKFEYAKFWEDNYMLACTSRMLAEQLKEHTGVSRKFVPVKNQRLEQRQKPPELLYENTPRSIIEYMPSEIYTVALLVRLGVFYVAYRYPMEFDQAIHGRWQNVSLRKSLNKQLDGSDHYRIFYGILTQKGFPDYFLAPIKHINDENYRGAYRHVVNIIKNARDITDAISKKIPDQFIRISHGDNEGNGIFSDVMDKKSLAVQHADDMKAVAALKSRLMP